MAKHKDIEETESTKKKHGTPLKYDPKFKGPIKNRSCTDIICCLLFIIFLGGLAAVGAYAFLFGEPRLLLYPSDSDGNLCGAGSKRDKPYLFFFDLIKCGRLGPGVFIAGCPTPQVCVSKCPDYNMAFIQATIDPSLRSQLICKYGVDKMNGDIKDLVLKDDCASYYVKSEPVLDRCVPKFLVDVVDAVVTLTSTDGSKINLTDANDVPIFGDVYNGGIKVIKQFLKAKELADKVINDLVATWWMILIGIIIAMFIAMIWIFIMRWVAGIMVWLTIVAFLGLFAFACYWCFASYVETKNTDQSFNIYLVAFTLHFVQSKFWLGLGIIISIILAIIVLVLLFLFSRIRIAITLIEEGSRAIGHMMFTLLWPLVPFALEVAVVVYWALVAVYLASTGRIQDLAKNNVTFSNGTLNIDAIVHRSEALFDAIKCDEHHNDTIDDICGVLKYKQQDIVLYMQIFNLFMLFWLVNFFIALGHLALAGAFASYYWAFDKHKDIPAFPILQSFYRSIRYHLGSLAFGSLIIAIVQIIRVFLEYIDGKLKASENPVAKFFMKCLKCCFWCLEKVLRFLTKNAYIMIGVHGKNFCTSAKNGFMLILRNVVRVAVVDNVTDFLMFICKLVVVGAVGAASFFFFDGRIAFLAQYQPKVNFYLVPVIVTILASYIVASCFFSVYEMAVDTLFLCFLEDIERHDGSAEKPYYMSKSLMSILGKKNKKVPKEDNEKK